MKKTTWRKYASVIAAWSCGALGTEGNGTLPNAGEHRVRRARE
jgi:hypothetical protein